MSVHNTWFGKHFTISPTLKIDIVQGKSFLSFQVSKAAFRRAKFLCHILHAEQSFLTLSFDTITVNQFSPMEFNKKITVRTEYLTKQIARRKKFGKEKLPVYLNLNSFAVYLGHLHRSKSNSQAWHLVH